MTINDVNDVVPTFDRRGSGDDDVIAVTVPEDAELGQSVITVTAQDGDAGDNGTVSYYLKETDAPFQVNSLTGQLKTSGRLDRERVDGYRLRVVATDRSGH